MACGAQPRSAAHRERHSDCFPRNARGEFACRYCRAHFCGEHVMTLLQKVAAAILCAIFVLMVLATFLLPAHYARQFRDIPNARPSTAHPLGTDALGRDSLSRLLYGTRVSLLLAPAAALLSTLIAAFLGSVAGLLGAFASGCSAARVRGHCFFDDGAAGLAGFGAPHLRFRARRSGLRFPAAGALHRLQASAPFVASRSAKSSPTLLRTVFHFHPALHFDGGKSKHFGSWSDGADAFLGKFDARFRGFLHALGKSLEAGAPGTARHRSHVFSTGSSIAGGHTVMRRVWFLLSFSIVLCWPASAPAQSPGQSGGELHFCLHGEPKTFNPLVVEDGQSETIRYLTGGVLIRLNRQTQALEPALATSWKVTPDGRTIKFHLRSGLHFSDGTPFTSEDVAYTVKALMDPQLHSPTGDSFRSSDGEVVVQTPSADSIVVTFPAPIAGLARLFDQVAILSAHSPKKEMAVLGPFYVADYSPGSYVLLRRNSNYWKKDKEGKPVPYLDSIRLDIQRNHDIEILRFRRGEIHIINALDADLFDRLQKESPAAAHDA